MTGQFRAGNGPTKWRRREGKSRVYIVAAEWLVGALENDGRGGRCGTIFGQRAGRFDLVRALRLRMRNIYVGTGVLDFLRQQLWR